jgi:hypothetical protein
MQRLGTAPAAENCEGVADEISIRRVTACKYLAERNEVQ